MSDEEVEVGSDGEGYSNKPKNPPKPHHAKTLGSSKSHRYKHINQKWMCEANYYTRDQGKLTCDKVHLGPCQIVGVRVSPQALEEYLGICGIVEKKEYPKPQYRFYNHGHEDDYEERAYGKSRAFEGLEEPGIAALIQQIMTPGMIVLKDSTGYYYLGYSKGESIGSCFVSYKYQEFLSLNPIEFENLQRLIYRIPLSENLSPEHQKVLNEIRKGNYKRFPRFFICFDIQMKIE